MAKKCYRIVKIIFSILGFVSLIIVGSYYLVDILPDIILLLILLLTVASIISCIIFLVRFMMIPKKWKKEFLKTHPESASIIFRGLDIIELDGVKPSVIDLRKKHIGFRGALFPTAPPYFRGWLDTDTPYRAFLENDGLALPFTLGAKYMNPVHYITEGEHKAVLSISFGRSKGKEIEFSFEVFRGKRYEIFYDRTNDKFDIKDISQEKGGFVSYI